MKQLSMLFLFLALAMTACSSQEDSADDLPAGDAMRGADLFSQSIKGAPACSSCHTVDGTPLVGPSFQDYGKTAPTRKSGISPEDYTYNSIIHPAADLVKGFSNVMYGQYRQRLSRQQIADLIAYLFTL